MKHKINRRKVNKSNFRKLFPKLKNDTNKGDMGRVLCVCGTADAHGASMCGAAYFAATAAYRCGAGIVEIFTERSNYAALATNVPGAVFSLYEISEDCAVVAERLKAELERADSVVIGCGIGKSEMSVELVKTVLANAKCPVLADADALNIIAADESLWELVPEEQKGRVVITPHLGEMARLTGKSVAEIAADPLNEASGFALAHGLVCVLKSHRTVITNGNYAYTNRTGNPGMATAGMGDILSGMIGSMLARGEDEKTSNKISHKPGCIDDPILMRAAVGVNMHGFAGDIAIRKTPQYALMSSDVLETIPLVFAKKSKIKEFC